MLLLNKVPWEARNRNQCIPWLPMESFLEVTCVIKEVVLKNKLLNLNK